MNKTKKIFFDIFIFIIPSAILLSIFTQTNWTVKIGDCTTDNASGFPFLSIGHFWQCITPNSSGDTWVNIPHFILNAFCKLTVAFLIYFFMFKKINLTKSKRILFIALSLIINILGTAYLYAIDFLIFDHRAWQDNVEIIKMHFLGL
jgi:hypothetical protein